MNRQPPLRAWPRWFVGYLVVCGLVLAMSVVQAAIPRHGNEYGGMGKTLTMIPVSVALDVLAAICVALAVRRSGLWRGETAWHKLLGVFLFLLGTTAAGVFVFVTCAVASRY